MAVLPSARRALSRPSRLPWLIAAAAALATTVTLPAYSLLHEAARGIEPSLPVGGAERPTAEASSVQLVARGARPLLSEAQQESLAVATASDVLLAADEATFLIERPATASTATTAGLVAEVSSTSTASRETGAVLTPSTSTSASNPVAESVVSLPAPQSAAAVPPPAQPVVQAFAGPVERWAASGIVIETTGQQLDDASLANVDAALSALPAGLLSSLGNPSFGLLHILVNTQGRVLSGDQPYGGPANFFSTNEATNELVLYPQQSVFTIVHELGHAYNLRHVGAGRYAMVLLDPEMQSFLAATGWTITSSDDEIRSAVDHMHVGYQYNGSFHWPRLSNDDPLEDFANSFATFLLDPGTLQRQSPERYAWMASRFGQ